MRFVKTAENLFSLPQGFTRVEYIQSTGTQYIDTGYKPVPATTKFEFMFQPDNISGNSFLFGCRPDTGIGSFSCTTYFATGSVRQDWAGLNTYFPITNVNTKYLYTAYDNSISLNTNSVTGTITRSTTRLNLNFLLCAVNTNGTADDRRFIGKIYFSRLWDNGVLVRDFIPCIDPLGVPCMYDLVGRKPYYNQGTGDFTAGRQIIPVEYLESTGEQYIDTGVTSNLNTVVEMNLKVVSYSTNNTATFFGGLTSNVGISTNISKMNTDRYSRFGTKYAVIKNIDIEGIKSTITIDKNAFVINGVSYAVEETSSFNGPNMYLFKGNGIASAYNTTTDIYSCKLWDNGVLVRDYIPCKDENDNGFLFDKVSGVCYLNNGTGNFAFGENKYKTKLRLIKDNKLPAGYTQVEYLESTGTQYIDTGVIGASGLKANVKFMWNTGMVGGDKYILGSVSTSPITRFYFGTYQSKWQYGYGSYLQAEGPQDNTLYDAEIGWLIGNQYVKINGETLITGTSATSYNTGYNLYLPSRNNGGSVETFTSSAKIYYCKIYNNDILVRDFVPALDPTGTPCMYDLVSRTPFYNQGTGTFSYGKTISMVRFIQDVIPREYAAVNYIESTGTQYIDTGIEGKDGITAETRIQRTTTSSNEYFVGAYNTVNRLWLVYTFGGQWYRGYNTIAGGWTPSTPITDWYTVKSSIPSTGTVVFDCNGTSISSTYTTGFNTGVNVQLFQMGNTGTNHYPAKGKMSYCKLYDNNTLVRNFIPVVRRIDKVAGMWDTITKQFFTTPVGAFNYG